ncbi:type II toxin-antitoxin system CcdA family antitoxin [Thermoplasmatota archaeon]
MSKRKLTLSINDILIKKARNHNINISSFLEIKLQEYLAIIEGSQKLQNESECGRRESNPGRGLGRP